MESTLFNSVLDDYHLLLALAALFKADFSIDWVEEITGRKPSQILSVFEDADQKHLLTKKKPGLYRFTNFEKQQWWQDRLDQEEKERLHQSIAGFLMKELPDDDSKAMELAHHLLHISNDWKGCHYLLNAGYLHIREFRTEEAVRCFTRVLNDLSNQKGEKEDLLFIKAAIEYSNISTARHDSIVILSVLHDAMVRAERWNYQTHQALLKMHIAKNELLRSQYNKALKHFEQGCSMAEELNDPQLIHPTTTFSTFFLFWQGRFREVIQAYETSIPEVEIYPLGEFPLLASITVGRAYTMIGQLTQGLGMLDTVREHCLKSGNIYMASHAEAAIGITMLDIRCVEDAIQYLKCSLEEANQSHNYWIKLIANFTLGLAYYLNGEKKLCISYLRKFLKHSKRARVSLQLFPYLMEICWAMEQGKLPHIDSLSFEKELSRMLQSKNTFIKGVAYRYQNLLQQREGLPPHRAIQSLNFSLKYLQESGHQIEFAKSQLDLARHYLSLEDAERGREIIQVASKVLSSINPDLIPDDFKPFIKDHSFDTSLLEDILNLGRKIVTLQDSKKMVLQIVSTVNRIMGAERGAIFLRNKETNPPKFRLRASKNLTSEQVNHPSFGSSMKMIEEVALLGKGRILGISSSDNHSQLSREIIRSRICAPIIFRGKVIGVLYHDNRLLSSVFNESDLELLAYFAALAALGIENTKAYEEIQRLHKKFNEEKLDYEEHHPQPPRFDEIIGESPPLKHVLAQIDQVASTDTTVLILGETGVGKDLAAKAIHWHSPRNDKPFIRVHCSALPESLITSELFGHEKGAFTGATHQRIGRFELADKGTLLLDEIGELPLEVQVRLLRVLQTKGFERVGGSVTLHSDFRLIATTNRDLEQEVKNNRFRADLYYRISVFPIYVPPLKERKEDIRSLAHYFIKIYARKMGKNFQRISEEEIGKMMQYDWPGNVRELENIIERGAILSRGTHFRLPALPINQPHAAHFHGFNTLKGQERQYIIRALYKTGWKVRGPGGAAEILDINPSTLASRMKKLGINRSTKITSLRKKSTSTFP